MSSAAAAAASAASAAASASEPLPPCRYFNSARGCRNPDCRFPHVSLPSSEDPKAPCEFFPNGKCTKGAACPLHAAPRSAAPRSAAPRSARSAAPRSALDFVCFKKGCECELFHTDYEVNCTQDFDVSAVLKNPKRCCTWCFSGKKCNFAPKTTPLVHLVMKPGKEREQFIKNVWPFISAQVQGKKASSAASSSA